MADSVLRWSSKHGAQAHILDSTWKGFGMLRALSATKHESDGIHCGNIHEPGREQNVNMRFGPS